MNIIRCPKPSKEGLNHRSV